MAAILEVQHKGFNMLLVPLSDPTDVGGCKKNHRKLCVGAREYYNFRIICKRNSCVKEISAVGKDFEFIKDKSKTRKT